jgi:hypothetical protein
MNKRVRFGIAILVLLLAIIFVFGLAQAFGPDQGLETASADSAQAEIIWTGQYVHRSIDPPVSVGTHNSIAFHPTDNKPRISYYDVTNGDLMRARPVPSGSGNCGVIDDWDCQIVDGEGNVGQYSSIAFWSDEGSDLYRIGISYYDATNGALKFAYWNCPTAACFHSIQTISDSTIFGNSIGLYTSLKFASDGTPHIAYYSTNIFLDTGSLHYAYPVGDGGNCGEGAAEGKWECTLIDSGSQVGKFASMDLDNEDRINFAYYDGGLGNLKHAYYMGFGGNCGGTEWKCDVVDGLFPIIDTGLYPSIKAPQAPGEKARIAYYDATNDKLRYAIQSSDDNCGVGWNCTDVDDMGSSLTNMGIALDLDQEGHPIIAYQQILDEFSHSTLRIARPYFVYDDGNFGNCGEPPPGYLFTYWRCNTLDNAGAHVYEADYVSLAVSPSNLAYIAYSEWDDYYSVNSLKLMNEYWYHSLFMPTLRK